MGNKRAGVHGHRQGATTAVGEGDGETRGAYAMNGHPRMQHISSTTHRWGTGWDGHGNRRGGMRSGVGRWQISYVNNISR